MIYHPTLEKLLEVNISKAEAELTIHSAMEGDADITPTNIKDLLDKYVNTKNNFDKLMS